MATQPSLPNMTTNVKFAARNTTNYNMETSVAIAQLFVTAAQLKTLKATPLIVVPAPIIVGEAINVDSINLSYNFGTTAFAGSGTLKVFYGPVANAHALCADQSTSFLTATASRKVIGIPPLGVSVDTNANSTNQPIFIANDGAAEFTTGDGTLTVTILYAVTTP
jgi:hypothetical protein